MSRIKEKAHSYKNGEQLAELYRKYRNMMANQALRVTRDRSAAEDCVHAVFEHLLLDSSATLLGLGDERKVRSYLLTCAYRAGLDYVRSASVKRQEPLEDYLHLRVQEDTESMFFTHDELAAVDTAIETLKHDYKEPMRLLRMGYSSREIAEILHLTEGCCKMRIARARQCLRELVGREENRGRR